MSERENLGYSHYRSGNSAYTDVIPKAARPKVKCEKCDDWVTLTPKQGGFIYPTHKISTHAGRCELSGQSAVKVPPTDDDGPDDTDKLGY